MSDVTHILSQIEQGDPRAADQLLPLVYAELRKLAAAKLAQEKPGQTLVATALVHEAYVRLVGGEHSHPGPLPEGEGERQRWDSRGHFFAAAAEAMRRILVENARRKLQEKNGGLFKRVEMADADAAVLPPDSQVLLLDEALTKLAVLRPPAAEIVQLRFFAGLTVEEAATVAGISARTARRLWVFAQAWLRREMERQDDPQSLTST